MDTKIKNVGCSRLGAMLDLEIQKEKEDMKASKCQQEIGGTAVWMKKLMMATKGCIQLVSNYTRFADNWFSGVKMSEVEMAEGVDYCRPVKMIHKNFV